MSRSAPSAVQQAAGNPVLSGRTDLACLTADPNLFFPAKGGPMPEAREVCDRCPVLDECRTWAIEVTGLDGMWGGTTTKEREAIRRERRRAKEAEANR